MVGLWPSRPEQISKLPGVTNKLRNEPNPELLQWWKLCRAWDVHDLEQTLGISSTVMTAPKLRWMDRRVTGRPGQMGQVRGRRQPLTDAKPIN